MKGKFQRIIAVVCLFFIMWGVVINHIIYTQGIWIELTGPRSEPDFYFPLLDITVTKEALYDISLIFIAVPAIVLVLMIVIWK